MADSRVRVNSAHFTSGSSRGVNFAEGAALDNTHLLICALALSSTSAPTTPAGWTALASLAQSSRGIYVYGRQGDSSTNGITVDGGGSVPASIFLMAYEGYSSLTPLHSSTGGSGIGTVDAQAIPDPGLSGGQGVIVTGMSVSGDVTFNPWASPYADVATAGVRGSAADVDYTGSGSYGTSISWTPIRTRAYAMVAMPLVAAPSGPTVSYALGSVPVTLAIGDTPVEASIG